MMTSEPRPIIQAAPFLTTRWTRVCLAKADSEDGRRALADLCDAYYEPVVAYLRSVLRDADAAREMSHAFFAEMLAGGTIHTADPERGRFRFYLLGAVKHFVAHHHEAESRQKRGGGVAPLSLDADSPDSPALNVPEDDRLLPEAAFDRQWAVTVLDRAMKALGAECAAQGKSGLIDQLRPWLLGESGYGDQSAVAETLGLSAAAMKVTVHRMRQRFRQCVKAEIAGTLKDADVIEDEMRSLLVALGG
ncbi:MAG: sigma-70 family RNA polymerase sigma factor [Prosthecobacter sp.]|uniref:RNA polymerase sigma factor n=1 Tax=Prosthecobacter sp. TaxID=1965333 RepID=UPI0025EAE285|nr:sigma-70 family RNA polymerase sigma factor [Prosthecobacter sp.]MCF7787596.1 sigma-70 family RNA polymerase sigma factor [Prosthecobacter sp.]